MAGAADSESEAVFPRTGWFEDAPVFFFADFSNAGEGIDEGVFLAKGEEGEVGTGVGEAGVARGDPEFGEAADFFFSFVIFANHVGEEFDLFSPVESSAKTMVEAEGFADALDPEFGAGGGEDELEALFFEVFDFFDDLGVWEEREPVCEEAFDVGLKFFCGHSPKVGMENALHSACSEDFVQRQKENENEGEEASKRFFSKDIGAKDELGVPGDDRLVEVEEDVGLGRLHWGKIRTYLRKGNFNRMAFGVSFSSVKTLFISLFLFSFAMGQNPVVPVLNLLVPDQEVSVGGADLTIDLEEFFGVEEVRDDAVRLTAEWLQLDGTPASTEIDFLLFRNRTPVTVENFRGYVNRGDYTDMFVHRLISNFVIQGGGFTVTNSAAGTPEFDRVTKLDPIVNEFGVSNTLATISMAKLGGDPDSATSEWFISTGANSNSLDNQNGGFTVFGRVSQGSFANVMALNNQDEFTPFNLGGVLANTPLVRNTTQATYVAERFCRFSSVAEVPLPAGQAGTSLDLTYSVLSVGGAGDVTASVSDNILALNSVGGEVGTRETVVVQAEDSVGNQVVDTFDVWLMANYEAWRQTVFTAAEAGDDSVSGPLADPNLDGVNNLMLFLQGLPIDVDASQLVSLPSFSFLEDSVTVEFETAFVLGVDFQVEGSEDLVTWDNIDSTELVTFGAGSKTVRLTTSEGVSSAPQKFYRIRYTLN